MKVLVTGGRGFIGRHVLDLLRCRNIPTIVVGRYTPGYADEYIEMDLLKTENFSELINQSKATHLLHLGWYVEHGEYWTSPLNLRWVDISTRLVEAFCKAGGRQVIVAGSCAEYDWQYRYCRESTTPLKPETLYGISKDACRRLIFSVCKSYRVPCSWGRVFYPFGPGEVYSRLIPSLIKVFQGECKPFSVNARVYRDFIYVTDVAEGLVTLLVSDADGEFNISSGEPVQIEEVVKEIAYLCDGDPQKVLRLNRSRSVEPDMLVGENKKLKDLGWAPKMPLKQGLRLSVEALKKSEDCL